MLNKVLIFILLTFSPVIMAGESCFIKTFPKLWTIEGTSPSQISNAIKKSNCSQKAKKAFLHFILTRKGNIHSSLIEREINQELKVKAKISPRKISINSLNTALKEKFSHSENWFFKKIKLNSQKKVLGLSKHKQILFHCNQCEFSGTKNIKLIIQDPIKNTNIQEWAQAEIKVRVTAFTANGDFNVNNSALSRNMFKKRYVYVSSPEKLFTNEKGLNFYKLNKPLKRGQPLLFSDLTSVNLVQSGRPTKIILNHNSLKISSQAMPMRSGKFGEIIQLRHLKTRKVIIGKIVDFNKVMVEL